MPLALGGLVMLMMYTWRRGSRLLREKTRGRRCLSCTRRHAGDKTAAQVPGTAVFLTSDPTTRRPR